jgi:hypothetical protein
MPKVAYFCLTFAAMLGLVQWSRNLGAPGEKTLPIWLAIDSADHIYAVGACEGAQPKFVLSFL